jgi:hypothetical protein
MGGPDGLTEYLLPGITNFLKTGDLRAGSSLRLVVLGLGLVGPSREQPNKWSNRIDAAIQSFRSSSDGF